MHTFVELPIDGDGVVLVEVEPVAGGPVPAGGLRETPARLAESMQAGLDRIKPVVSAFVDRFQRLPDRPDELSLKFGVRVSGDAGLVIARSAVEASFEITATWRSGPSPDPPAAA